VGHRGPTLHFHVSLDISRRFVEYAKVLTKNKDDFVKVVTPVKTGPPLGITMEELLMPHGSVLRNKGIGAILYGMTVVLK